MNVKNKYISLVYTRLLPVLCLLIFAGCEYFGAQKNKNNEPLICNQHDLTTIKDEGVLRAVVDYNSTNYFVYRGRPMGFTYELLQLLSNDLGVDLKIVVSNNLAETFNGLMNKDYELIAKNLTITKERNELVDFTSPINQTRQVLVQRAISESTSKNGFITSNLELAGKQVYVQKNTSYYERLVNLSEEIGHEIEIIEDSVYGVEQLIARVASGDIDYTVCDENVAELNATFYPNIDVSLKLSLPQNIAWAVRKDSEEWKDYLDNWIDSFKLTRKYQQVYYRYFKSPRIASRWDSDFNSITGGKISDFDKQVKEVSVRYNWDWRLISAIIYHESRFNPEAGSWVGAYGLMQIMPSTAKSLGVDHFEKPEQNIKAGILLLNWLNKQFIETIPDSTQRIKFVLASYNIGLGHVKDAQRLADKYNKDRHIWDDNVDIYLKNKSIEKYFTDPVVRYGYCRGEEAYNYVNKVVYSYRHYLNVIPR